jgi:hypothetical protein
MTRQALYRLAQLAAGLCASGCGRPRWGQRTRCRPCTWKLRHERALRYADAREDARVSA